MNRNPYTYLAWIALIVMPLSASINFGWHAYTGMVDLGVTAGLAKAGGISLASGLELLGIIAGHLAIKSYSIRNYTYLGITATATVLYVVVGTFEMADIPFARFVPLLASCLYVLVGIQSEIDEAVAKATTTEKRSAVIDYRLKEAEAERAHQLELERLRLANEVKLAKVQAATAPQPEPVAPVAPQVAQLTETQQRILDAFREKPNATITEIAGQLGVTRQAVSKQVQQMNGVLHEVRI